MLIEARFLQDDINCYRVVDDTGMKYNVTFRGLYDTDLLDQMKNAGFKILDYHGHILTPEGIAIEDIALSENVLNESEINMMKELDSFALSEAEATSYFARDVQRDLVQLKKPVVTINTREELIDYLNKYIVLSRSKLADDDCLPLNSFVNPDALFTLEEIQTDARVQYYMEIIERRRILKSYNAYLKLIDFLKQQGCLSEPFSADDVKKAYLSWGICGVKTMITHMSDKMGVTNSIYDFNDDSSKVSGNTVYNLMDKKGQIISRDGTYDIADIDNFESLDIRPMSENEYYDKLHKARSWETEYQVIRCLEIRGKTRTLMSLVDDSGITYKAKFDHNTFIVTTSRGNVLVQRYIAIRVYNGVVMPIDRILTKEDYEEWCACSAKAHDLVEANTLKSDVSSSYELLTKEGLHKKAVVEYMARRVEEDRQLNNGFDPDVPLSSAADMYSGNIAPEYIRKYNPSDMPWETIDELVDIMLATKDEMEANKEYLVVDESNAATKFLSKDEIALRPVEQLEFAKDVLNGDVSIDQFEAGRLADGKVDYILLSEFLRLCYKQLGAGKTITDFLMHLDEYSEFVDFGSVFTKRVRAYWGAVNDTAYINNLRATEAVTAVYVTNVFREISNGTPDSQRHYAFECVSMDLSSKKHNPAVALQRRLAEIIAETIDSMGLEYKLREALKMEKESLALDLMFRLALDSNVVQEVKGATTVVKLQHALRSERVELNVELTNSMIDEIKNPAFFIVTYCKLSDWCRFDFANGYARLYCLNAAITPWRVVPKPGFKLNSYNFPINYLSNKSYERIDAALRADCDSKHGKVAVLKGISNAVLIPDSGTNIDVTYTLDDMEIYLQNTMFLETMDQYFSRFNLQNKEAIAKGIVLKRMRTKSDVVFENFADRYSSDYMSADVDEYVAATPDNQKLWTRSVDVLPLDGYARDNTITANKNVVDHFDINTEAYADVIRWPELLHGEFHPKAILLVFGTKLLCATDKGQLTRDLEDISREDCEKLVEKGIFYKLSAREYLISAGNGTFKVEVR